MDTYEQSVCLGREFLTWIWAQTELRGGDFDLDGRRLALMVDQELVLIADLADGGTDILRAGSPAGSPEAMAALNSGKKVRQLKLCLAEGEQEWLFSLDDRLQIRGLRLPFSDEEHPSDIYAEQLASVETAVGFIDQLFAEFIMARLSDQWSTELQRMRAWIAERSA